MSTLTATHDLVDLRTADVVTEPVSMTTAGEPVVRPAGDQSAAPLQLMDREWFRRWSRQLTRPTADVAG